MEFKETVLENKTVVHCQTEHQAIQLLTWADSKGCKWGDGTPFTYANYNWSIHRHETCYCLSCGEFALRTTYEYKNDYTILDFEEALIPEHSSTNESKEIEFKCNNKLEFNDISEEDYRVYEYENFTIRLQKPLKLRVSSSGGHYVFTSDGISHYIPVSWKHLYWKVTEGNHFSFLRRER